jgi:hypothetical protein
MMVDKTTRPASHGPSFVAAIRRPSCLLLIKTFLLPLVTKFKVLTMYNAVLPHIYENVNERSFFCLPEF